MRPHAFRSYVALLIVLSVVVWLAVYSWDSARLQVDRATYTVRRDRYIVYPSLQHPNLALADNGAGTLSSYHIDGTSNTRRSSPHPEHADGLALNKLWKNCLPNNPLHPTAEPDRRWCVKGSTGQLGILLSFPAHITNISVAHPSTFASLPTAPRTITVWGVVDGDDNKRIYKESEAIFQNSRARLPVKNPYSTHFKRELTYVPLAAFSFNIRDANLFQTFGVFPEMNQLRMDFGIVVIQITSNWGEVFTALHHVRIYGERANHVVIGRMEE